MTDIVTIEDTGDGIFSIRLNRPERKNALSLEMFEAIPATCEELAGKEDLRAVIMSGSGGDFCAGLDLSVFGEFAQRLDEVRGQLLSPLDKSGANYFQRPVTCWSGLEVPVIAAIDGVCFGGGMQLALGADFRIAAPDTRFSIMETKWGLIPDMGITAFLPALMRADQAKDLIMTARVLQAAEACDLGLITRISDDPHQAARELALTLAAKSPDAVNAAKELIDRVWSAQAKDGLALEAELQHGIIGKHNQVEAVMANMQKREPKFR